MDNNHLSRLCSSCLWTETLAYDASGSSSLQTDPTAAPAGPLAELSAAEDVSLSAVHTRGPSPSQAEGLPGKPAFSSVLTVMAGTVKHPGSADGSRASPTVSMDRTHTTQRPSRSSSRDSEMASSVLSAGARTLPSSGLILSCSRVFLNHHMRHFYLQPLHLLSASPSLSPAESVVIRPSPAEQINNAASPFL